MSVQILSTLLRISPVNILHYSHLCVVKLIIAVPRDSLIFLSFASIIAKYSKHWQSLWNSLLSIIGNISKPYGKLTAGFFSNSDALMGVNRQG